MSLWNLIVGATLVALGGCQGGCSLPANPGTHLQAGPFGSYFRFDDTKDNDIEIEDAKFDPETKTFSVKKITVRNNASDPRRANVEQITAYTEQVKAVSAMGTEAFKALASFAPTLGNLLAPRASSVSVDVPGLGGGTISTSPVLPLPTPPAPPPPQPVTP